MGNELLTQSRQVWLELSPSVSVAVPYDEAILWGKQEFVNVYLQSVYGSKRREAEDWAARQMADRDAYLRDLAPGIDRE